MLDTYTHTFFLHHSKLLYDALNLLPVQTIGASVATRNRSSEGMRLQTFLQVHIETIKV